MTVQTNLCHSLIIFRMIITFFLCTRVILPLLEITFFLFHFLSLDLHELWCSMMSTCLITEVKWQWATLVLAWVTASLRLALVDQNHFWPCLLIRPIL